MMTSQTPSRGELTAPELAQLLHIDEFEAIARTRLPEMAYAYYAGGSGDEQTMRGNRAAWEAISIWYRVMVDVSARSSATTLLNLPLAFPMLAAPSALQKMAHPDGELATARACSRAGIPMVVSSLATTSIEEICAATRAPVLFQIYIGMDRGFVGELVSRAAKAGVSGFQLTVDAPVWGMRGREMKSGFHVPVGMSPVNIDRPGRMGEIHHGGVGITQVLGWTISPSITWKDLEWLASATSLPVMVKGICRADDAQQALRSGARGIVVSNHGGRQLDGSPPTAHALARIAAAVSSRAPIVVDGGIRTGTDILRALALGATAVQVGRPILWGLGCAGEAGVCRVLELFAGDFDRAMALSGCPTIASITRDLVDPVDRRQG